MVDKSIHFKLICQPPSSGSPLSIHDPFVLGLSSDSLQALQITIGMTCDKMHFSIPRSLPPACRNFHGFRVANAEC